MLVTRVAVKLFTLALLLEIDTFCGGTVLFAAILKLKDVGFADNGLAPPEGLALYITATLTNPEGELMLTNPTSVPEAGALAPTETDSVSGVVPLVGFTCSQLLFEKAETVKLTGPIDDETCNGCAGPAGPLKVSCGGLTVREPL